MIERKLLLSMLRTLLILLLVFDPAAVSAQVPFVVGRGEFGRVVARSVEGGLYLQYVPRRPTRPLKVLVICHGTPDQRFPALAAAGTFIQRWIPLAERFGIVLIAPAFDDENYGSLNAPDGWGYRALVGRTTNADEFVIQIVDQYAMVDGTYDGKIYLYGHSAGGQFANRFVIAHPDRVNAAVISSAKWYAMPDPTVRWPNGTQTRKQQLQWGGIEKQVEIIPDPVYWQVAARLPITVVVGERDTEQYENAANQGGTTRIERGLHWVNQMNALATTDGGPQRYRFILVPGIGHDSKRLTPACMQAFMGN